MNKPIDLSPHPILQQAFDVIQAIEKCGASVELTNAVTKAGELMTAINELIAIREMKGDQVPVDTGIFTRDELISVCEDRMRDMPEDYAPYQIAKIALRSLFSAPQKPVLPDELREDILRCVDDSMHGCNSISAPDYAVRVAGWLAAGGIVKDGE